MEEIQVSQMQEDRTARARAALANGEIRFASVPGGWLVTNGGNRKYTVSANLDTCTCPDHTERGAHMGFRCKHLEAARMLFMPRVTGNATHTHTQGGSMQPDFVENGWVKLFHPAGVQVTLPVPTVGMINTPQAQNILRSVSAYIDAGFLVNAPGLDDGELVEEISEVARREAKDGTPIIDFYPANTRLTKKYMHAYMNSDADIAAFETAAGIKLDQVPLYEGALAIARDDSKAKKYIVSLPHPIKLVWRLSPKWEEWKAAGGEGQEPHKRLLVRYDTPLVPSLPVIRQYVDGSLVNGDANEQAAFDAHFNALQRAPESKDALKTWAGRHKHLITFPNPVATAA